MDWLGVGRGDASPLDGFVRDLDAPEGAGHRLIEGYIAEALAVPPSWNADFSLKRFESGRRILEGTIEEQAMVAVAAVERALWLSRQRKARKANGLIFHRIDPHQVALHSIPQTILRTLARRRLGFTEKQSELVLALLAGISAPYLVWWLPVKSLLSQIEPGNSQRPLPPTIRRGLERLRAHLESAHDNPDVREMKVRITQLLADGQPHAVFEGNERWVLALMAEMNASLEPEKSRWLVMYEHLLAASSAKPGAKWLNEASRLRDAIGAQAYHERAHALLDAVEENSHQAVLPRNADFVRGLIWTLAEWTDVAEQTRLVSRLGDLALALSRKLPNIGMRSVKVVNACVTTLGRMHGMEPLAQLTRLRAKIKAVQPQKVINTTLEGAAGRHGMPLADLEELVTPTFGMDEVGLLTESFGAWTAELRITGTDSVEIRWRRADGKEQKTLPKDVQRDHAAEVKELKATAQEMSKMLAPQRDRIERMLVEERVLPFARWRERYLDHPLVGPLARRLLWHFEDGKRSALGGWQERELTGADDRPIDWLAADTRVRLWHPLGFAVETVTAWREWLERHQIVQPFKQAHREVYIVTDAELATATYSNRFAAHILKQHQLAALCRSRGWRYSLQGAFDGGGTVPTLALPRHGLRAEFWVEACQGDADAYSEAGISIYAGTDQVRFVDDGGHVVPIHEVPALAFSETMRDVDLFVGVASVGADPAWTPTGDRPDWAAYWQGYAFGELSASAQTRREVLARLLPRLRIVDRCRLDGKFLVVRGDLRTYRIHLGSGNILMEPNDQYLCIVPDRASAGRQAQALWLPFEGDSTMSVIISKAFLLAADTKITDATIVRQIRK